MKTGSPKKLWLLWPINIALCFLSPQVRILDHDTFPLFFFVILAITVIGFLYLKYFPFDRFQFTGLCLLIIVIPLSHSLGQKFPALRLAFLFFPVLYFFIFFWVRGPKAQDPVPDGPMIPRTSWLILLAVAIVLRGLVVMFLADRWPTVDVGLSTTNAAYHLLQSVNPYAAPEIPVTWHDWTIHQQNYMYPPFMFLYYLPSVFFLGIESDLSLYLVNFLNGLGIIFLIYLVTKELLGKNAARLASLAYAFFPTAIFEDLARGVNDTVPLLLALAAVYFLLRQRGYLSFACFALSVASKWVPGIFLVSALILLFNQKKFGVIAWGLGIVAVILAVLFLPFLLWDAQAFCHDMSWEGVRPIEVWESRMSIQCALFHRYFMPLQFGAVLAFFALRFQKIRTSMDFYREACMALLLFMLFTKIYHAHHILWYAPYLIPLLFFSASSHNKGSCAAKTAGVKT